MTENKKYYRIGEVCKITGIEPHHLRYWEKEIPAIRAHRSLRNHRLYSRETVELISKIKSLLEEGYRLETVKNKIKEDKKAIPISTRTALELLKEIKIDLQKVKSLLEC